jgi:uncharacterized protein
MTIFYEYKCPNCGLPLSAAQPEMCQGCGTRFTVPSSQQKIFDEKPDPDHPFWSIGSAIGLWAFSVAAIIMAPLVATLFWTLWQKTQGIEILKEDFSKLLNNPTYVLLFILATFGAQVVTLLVAYQLVTRNGQGFFAALGWNWHPRFRLLQSIIFTILIIVLAIVITNLLPNKETGLERLLNVSFSVRVLTAVVAVLGAPIVEEVIYRGILFSALRKNFGPWPAIIAVSVIFVSVHVPQYWGGWGVLAALSLLSFGLTVVRAYTSSLLPCFVIHLLFNSVNAVGIILEGLRK